MWTSFRGAGQLQPKLKEVFAGDPINKINNAILAEVKSTGLFDKVITISKDKIGDEQYLKKNNINYVMTSTVEDIKWEVPGYKAMAAKGTAILLLTGVVGSAIYGTTPTKVNGTAKVKVKLVDVDTMTPRFERKYHGTHEETMPKNKCGTLKTKSSMMCKSLENALGKLKEDLQVVVARKP